MTKTTYEWPDWMPVPLVDGYGIQVTDRRISTDMEVGGSIRVEFDTDESTADCSLLCDPLQAEFFETFERDILNQGAVWFKMKIFVGGKMETHTVRFKSRPALASVQGGRYSAYSFTLDIAKREGLMDKDLAGILIIFGPEFIHYAADRLHYILHVEAPKVTSTPANIWTATAQDWENAK